MQLYSSNKIMSTFGEVSVCTGCITVDELAVCSRLANIKHVNHSLAMTLLSEGAGSTRGAAHLLCK